MKRTTTSLKIDPKLWKRVKLYCVKEEIHISDFLEDILKGALKSKKP